MNEEIDFKNAHALSLALEASMASTTPRAAALALGSVINSRATHPSTGPEFVSAVTVILETLGWCITRDRLPVPDISEALPMEWHCDGQERVERLPLSKIRAIVFDIDGSIRRCTIEGQPCPNKPGEWELQPGVREFFAWLLANHPEVKIGYATNQGGVARGYLTLEVAAEMAREAMTQAVGGDDNRFSGMVCPSIDKENPMRKPRPGMLLALADRWGIAPYYCLFIGDMESDRQAAMAAGWFYMDHQMLIPRWAP